MTTIRTSDPDIYGQSHPVETPEIIAAALEEFRSQLHKASASASKNAVLHAQAKCPELLTDDFHLFFLRCEVFHIDVSVLHLVRARRLSRRPTGLA
jgi:hypothetical protein